MAGTTKLTEGVAYLRTSSSTNVGADKDSDKRQRAAITAFAKRAKFVIVGEFYDAAVSGRSDREPAGFCSAARTHRGQRRPCRACRGCRSICARPCNPGFRRIGVRVGISLGSS
jgi:hypothetical protein